MNLIDLLPSRGVDAATNLFDVVRRRVWSKPGTLHVELPALTDEEYREFTETLRRQLEATEGVIWARANGAMGRMIIAWDRAQTDRETILEVVDDLEGRYRFSEGDYDATRPDHPGDDEPFVRGIARIIASLAGTGAGMVAKLLERAPGRRRFDLAALMAVIDNVPHVRKLVSERLGEVNTETWLGLTNPLVQGLGSGPVGPAVETFYQVARLVEAVERRRGWKSREPQLCSHPDRVAAPRRSPANRSTPLPDGPIERYATDAWDMSLGGFIVGLADTQQLERAITPVLDALPKPGRYGRNAFCASLTGVLADRQMVVMDPEALRRLDRVDCAIVHSDLLVTDCYRLARIATDENVDRAEVFERAERLLDPLNPELHQHDGDWQLGPAHNFEVPDRWVTQLRAQGARGDLLALADGRGVRALFSLRVVTDRASRAFVDAVQEHELELIVLGDDPDTARQFQPDRLEKPAGALKLVRHLQREEHVVALFDNRSSEAMAVADVGVGFVREDRSIPWEADLLGAEGLEDATFVIEAIAESKSVARRCAMFATTGAGIGALSAIRGLEKTRPSVVTLAVNAASAVALGYGAWRARLLEQRIVPAADDRRAFHRMRVHEVFDELDSDPGGLSARQADDRRPERAGPPPQAMRALRAVGRELANPLTPVLAGGAAVSAVVGSLTDAAIVTAVIALNGVAGGIERFNAEESIEAMARREAIDVKVRRSKAWTTTEADELVVGDVIRLQPGDVVPADCRIVESEHLEVDESSLTGESLPVAKNPAPSFAPVASERTSMVYEGTAVVTGTTTAVVVATGEDTEMRRTRLIGAHRETEPGVEARLQNFTDMTLPYVGAAGGILMTLGVFRRRKLEELAGPAVNLAIGAVPEGLPLLATAAQLAASRRLAERGVVVQNPRAMEALGRTELICIDKTGTLTEGTLRLEMLFDGDSAAQPGQWQTSHEAVLQLALRATPVSDEDEPLPHATDQAIAEGARDADVDRGEWHTQAEIPFRTERAFHACVGRDDSETSIVVKGSPEEVLERCSRWYRDESRQSLNDRRRNELFERAEQLAGRGLRVLAVAERRLQQPVDGQIDPDRIRKLTFRGFVGLSDPLRAGARGAVESLYAAGVAPMMLTGDHPETARRIARRVGLDASQLTTGDEIAELEGDDLAEALADVDVVARMTPTHKVRIVEALQQSGHAVAMTGDGGNDAAAIRLADAGIALGADCAPAAREAADLVVSDARIDTIVDAVVEGRGMWRAVRDAASILIGGNLGEILFMLASGVTHTIPALNARQLLLVNLFTDVAPALAVASRTPPEVSPEQLLHEGPEQSLGKPLERDIAWRAAITGSSAFLAWLFARYTFQKKRASTVGLVTVVSSQLVQTLTSAKPGLPVWAASVGSAAALLAIVETPGISHLFGSRPLGPLGLTTAFGASGLAAGASLIIPRLPEWKDAIARRLPRGEEPTSRHFLDEFYANSPA